MHLDIYIYIYICVNLSFKWISLKGMNKVSFRSVCIDFLVVHQDILSLV